VNTRSSRREVRNPMLALPAMQAVLALPPDQRLVLARLCEGIADDARARAEKCWRTHKAPMAAYWKAVAVYSGHLRRAIR
jgi:hypothetical protein